MLELNGLSKSFGGKTVIPPLFFTWSGHGIYSLMSPSGSGKTTLLRILAGLERPDAGTIVSDLDPPSLMFQDERFFPHLSLYENLRLVGGECDALLKEFGLYDARDLGVRELSGGMLRRASLIRALLYSGNFLLLDEPFSGLDRALRERIMAAVKRYRDSKTILLCTHDLYEACAVSDQIILFDRNFSVKKTMIPDNSCPVDQLAAKYGDLLS